MVGFSLLPLLIACEGPRVPHAGDEPLFPLIGAHAAIPCAACHGEGTPTTQPNTCIECHSADTPDPNHYPGQDCAICHDQNLWSTIIVGSDADTDTDTDSDTDTDTDTDTEVPFDHATLAANTLCSTCHEEDRKDVNHNVLPEPWDCGPCHQSVTAWSEAPVQHPARTPHGQFQAGSETPEAGWIIACVDCHGISPPIGAAPSFDCSGCHDAIFPHYGAAQAPGDAANAACMGCHDRAEY